MATKQLKDKKVPNLRFKGFEGGWVEKKLGEVGEVKMCRRIFNEETSVSGEIPFFKIGSFGKTADAYISKELYWDYRKKFSFPKKGDILISAAGTIGRTFVYQGEDSYYQDSNIVWIDNDNTKVTNEFLFHILQIVKYNTEGGTIQRLYNNILKSTKFSTPTIPEQTKISSFLFLINDRVRTQIKIIQRLESLIKDVREKIFRQQMRFKDNNGKSFQNWEKNKLGDIGEVVSGLTYSPNDINENGILVLRSSNIQNRNIVFDDNVYVNSNKFNALLENDILICVRNGSRNLIGKNAIIKKGQEGYAFGAFMTVYRSEYNNFLYHWFDTEKYKEEVYKNLGATINSINGSDLRKFEVPFPCIEEQQKIASVLSSIDEKINIEKKLLKQYENQKRYLLANLFV